MKNLIQFLAVALIFCSCSNNTASNNENQSDTTNQIKIVDLIGDWELVRWTVQGENDVTENNFNLSDRKIWTFSEDSISVICYPFYLFNNKPFRVKGDSLFYSWNEAPSYDEDYHMRFKGDTLLLKGETSSSNEDRLVFRSYLVRTKADNDTLNRLKSTLVDWSFYQKKWQYDSNYSLNPDELSLSDSTRFPHIIDLTLQDEANFSFDGYFLEYPDPKNNANYFWLEFSGHSIKDNEVKMLILSMYLRDLDKSFGIRYKEFKQ